MRITPTILTNNNTRVMSLNEHQKQVSESRLVPIQEVTAGWFTGGQVSTQFFSNPYILSTSIIDRIIFANDTTINVIRGPLSSASAFSAQMANATDGWVAGGFDPSRTEFTSLVQRITFQTDTSIATLRGNTSQSRQGFDGGGNSTDGWMVGGQIGTSTFTTRIDRITFANDNVTASARGNAPATISSSGVHQNTANLWFFGQDAPLRSNTYRITLASDTNAAVSRGTLTIATGLSATGNITDAWLAGFEINDNMPRQDVNRVIFAQDTVTATNRGQLIKPTYITPFVENTTDGWLGGGFEATGSSIFDTDDIQRITFANDTVLSSVRGKRSYSTSASSGL